MNFSKLIVPNNSGQHPCQDYAICNPDKGLIAVSDGCSSSSDTDFGSRILLKLVEQHLHEIGNTTIVSKAFDVVKTLGLPEDSLDATICRIDFIEHNFCAAIFGDGVFVYRKVGDDAIYVEEVSYSRNYPMYPSYAVRLPNVSIDGNDKVVTRSRVTQDFVQKDTITDYGEWDGATFWIGDVSEYTMLAVATDGLFSIMTKDKGQRPRALYQNKELIVNDLFSFKTSSGEFLTRRWNGFHDSLLKDHDSILVTDDLTIACAII